MSRAIRRRVGTLLLAIVTLMVGLTAADVGTAGAASVVSGCKIGGTSSYSYDGNAVSFRLQLCWDGSGNFTALNVVSHTCTAGSGYLLARKYAEDPIGAGSGTVGWTMKRTGYCSFADVNQPARGLLIIDEHTWQSDRFGGLTETACATVANTSCTRRDLTHGSLGSPDPPPPPPPLAAPANVSVLASGTSATLVFDESPNLRYGVVYQKDGGPEQWPNHWVHSPFTLTDLSPGAYSFKVRANDRYRDGLYSEWHTAEIGTSGTWTSFQQLNGECLKGSPAVANIADPEGTRVEIYAASCDGKLLQWNTVDRLRWNGPLEIDLQGISCVGPTPTAITTLRRIDIFIRNCDANPKVYHRFKIVNGDGTRSFSKWAEIPGVCARGPIAAYNRTINGRATLEAIFTNCNDTITRAYSPPTSALENFVPWSKADPWSSSLQCVTADAPSFVPLGGESTYWYLFFNTCGGVQYMRWDLGFFAPRSPKMQPIVPGGLDPKGFRGGVAAANLRPGVIALYAVEYATGRLVWQQHKSDTRPFSISEGIWSGWSQTRNSGCFNGSPLVTPYAGFGSGLWVNVCGGGLREFRTKTGKIHKLQGAQRGGNPAAPIAASMFDQGSGRIGVFALVSGDHKLWVGNRTLGS